MGLLSDEPILRKELDLILAGTGVCRFFCMQQVNANRLHKKSNLALLSDGNHGGMERFIVQEANKRADILTPANVNVDVRSQLAVDSDNCESQPITFGFPSTVIDSAKIRGIRAIDIPGMSGR